MKERISFTGSARNARSGKRHEGRYAATLLLVENHLVRTAKHALHGFKIETFARQSRRPLVLLINLVKSGSLASRLGDGLLR